MNSRFFLVCLLTLLAFNLHANEKSNPLKEGGTWISKKTSKKTPAVKVKIDPANQDLKQNSTQGIHVFLNKAGDQNPASIGINFIDANGKKTYVELKAADPLTFPTQYDETTSALANAHAQSYIGFELKIPFEAEKSTTIPSEDLQKQTEGAEAVKD